MLTAIAYYSVTIKTSGLLIRYATNCVLPMKRAKLMKNVVSLITAGLLLKRIDVIILQ